MPTYMDLHYGMHGVTPDGLKAAHQADLDIQDDEAVKRIHERAGHPATEVYPVPVEV